LGIRLLKFKRYAVFDQTFSKMVCVFDQTFFEKVCEQAFFEKVCGNWVVKLGENVYK
jgi:hypothetical protein